MALTKTQEKKNYVSILSSDATLRMVVPTGTPDSVVRTYETSDGKTGTKTELVFNKMSGKITDISFFDGDFGKLLQLDITDDAGTLTLSVNTAQNYGEDLMKKIPSLDLSKGVEFAPYSFIDDNGKTRKGVTVTQEGKKIQNFFYDIANKKNLYDYPTPTGSEKDKDDWKVYFIQARKFLVAYIEKNFPTKNTPKVVNADDVANLHKGLEVPTGEIDF